jgi:cell division protein FtsB
MFNKFKESAFWKIIRNKYLLVTVVFFVWITFFDSNSLIKCSRVVSSISSQEQEKRYYKDEIKSIEEKLNELSSNRDSLEKFAREQYKFHKDDEDVYIIIKEK